MKTAVFATALLSSSIAFASEVDRTVDVDGFDSIYLKGSMDVELVQADNFSVVVATDEEWQQWVIIERHGDTLEIKLDEDRPNSWFSDDPRVRVFVSMPEIEELVVQGSGEIVSNAVLADDLELRVDGSGDIEVTELGAGNLTLLVNGSGDIKLWKAVAEDTRIKVSGSGDVKIAEAIMSDFSSLIRGSGDVKVAGQTVNAEISIYGSGDFDGRSLETLEAEVTIYGSGDVWLDTGVVLNQTIRGSGDVHISN